MSSQAHAAPAQPDAQNAANRERSGSDPRKFYDIYGKRIIIAVVALFAILWIGSMVQHSREVAEQKAAAQAQAQQAEVLRQAQVALEQQKICGSSGQPVCECKGDGIVMRYLKPGRSAKVAAKGAVNFDPSPSPATFILCDPEHRDTCVNGRDKNIQVGMSLLVMNTSDRMQNITCEYD